MPRGQGAVANPGLGPGSTIQSTAIDVLVSTALDARYEIVDQSMSATSAGDFVARRRDTNATVRLKVVPISRAGRPDPAARPMERINNAATLHHPRIERVWAAGRISERAIVIETEYVAGRTLRERLAQGTPIVPAEVERVLRACSAALEFAHNVGVVHGAVEPRNILIDDETDRVVLGGFCDPLGGIPSEGGTKWPESERHECTAQPPPGHRSRCLAFCEPARAPQMGASASAAIARATRRALMMSIRGQSVVMHRAAMIANGHGQGKAILGQSICFLLAGSCASPYVGQPRVVAFGGLHCKHRRA